MCIRDSIKINHELSVDGVFDDSTHAGLLSEHYSGMSAMLIQRLGVGSTVNYMPAVKSDIRVQGVVNNLIQVLAVLQPDEVGDPLEGQLVLPYARRAMSGVSFTGVSGVNLVAGTPFWIAMWGNDGSANNDNVDMLVKSSGASPTIGTGNTLTYDETDLFLNGPHTAAASGNMQINYTNVTNLSLIHI